MATRQDGTGLDERPGTSTALSRPTPTELATSTSPERLDERSAEIRATMDQARRQISESLDDIQVSLEQTLDWRGWVDEHPWEAVGIGLAVGFYLGLR